MAIHIANPEAVEMAHELARRLNTTLTMAVKISVRRHLKLLLCEQAWLRLRRDRTWAALKVRARSRQR